MRFYLILLLLLIFLLISTPSLKAQQNNNNNNNNVSIRLQDADSPFCFYPDGISVPRGYNRTVILGKHSYVEPDLQIYTNRKIECDGYLVQWHFVARNKLVYGLHLGVFRKNQDVPSVYRLVNSTFIQLSVVRNYKGRPTWVSYRLAEPFPVKKGDFLGSFYERFDTPQKLLTIISGASQTNEDLHQNTFLIPLGHEVLKRDSVDSRDGIIVDVLASNARFEHRDPALTAVISRNYSAAQQRSSFSTRLTQQRERDPFRLLGPSFENDPTFQDGATCPQGSQSSFISAFRGMKVAFGDSRFYPSLEAGLHIFEELRVPCKGQLVEWSFLAPSLKHHFIYGLNLAVFRPKIEGNETTFQIVNATRIGVAKITPKIAGKWLAYSLPVESRFSVHGGDYLGFYYNQFKTMSQFLTIPTSNDDPNNFYTSWVFEYDKKIIESSIYNKTVNVKNAILTHRRPALAAKIVLLGAELGRGTTIGSPSSRRMTAQTRSPLTTVTARIVTPSSDYNSFEIFQPSINNNNVSNRRIQIWINVITSGKTSCTSIRTNTSIFEFESAEDCKIFTGDNKRECKIEAAPDGSGFGICIATKADCHQIGAVPVRLHRTATMCYGSINRSYRSCLHEDGDLLYCSPVNANSKTCFAKNTECLDYIVNNSYAYDE